MRFLRWKLIRYGLSQAQRWHCTRATQLACSGSDTRPLPGWFLPGCSKVIGSGYARWGQSACGARVCGGGLLPGGGMRCMRSCSLTDPLRARLIAQSRDFILGWRGTRTRALPGSAMNDRPHQTVVTDGGRLRKARKKAWLNTRPQRCTFTQAWDHQTSYHHFGPKPLGETVRLTSARERSRASGPWIDTEAAHENE